MSERAPSRAGRIDASVEQRRQQQDEAGAGVAAAGGGGTERGLGAAGRASARKEAAHGLRHGAAAQVPDLCFLRLQAGV